MMMETLQTVLADALRDLLEDAEDTMQSSYINPNDPPDCAQNRLEERCAEECPEWHAAIVKARKALDKHDSSITPDELAGEDESARHERQTMTDPRC